MRLSELDPEWIRWEDRSEPRKVPDRDISTPELYVEWERAGRQYVDGEPVVHTYRPSAPTLAEAQGIEFDCPAPACQAKGPHRIQVAFHGRGVLDHHGSRGTNGQPTRWHVAGGSTFEDLTLTPSIDCTAGDPSCWHGWITSGEAK